MRDRGAGTVVVIGVVALVFGIGALTVPVATVGIARHRAAAAADAAALAAADVLVGIAAGAPCAVAEQVAAAAGVDLTECIPEGLVVTVAVHAPSAFGLVAMAATAGPPP
jgi:secretion/DNA translocation related TadE-like protein